MAIGEFLRTLTRDQIDKASTETDENEDAAKGSRLEGTDYIDRMDFRLRDAHPGIYERIRDYVHELRDSGEADPHFIAGVFAGATMLAHDLTITAEIYDAEQLLGDTNN